ncbi:MAG: N-acetylmuramoyl-L-alanine amidase [Oscillospiraceae bacterium]
MIITGKLIRAEIFDDHTAPYSDVEKVYKANKDRFPSLRLVVVNAHWYNAGAKPCGNYKVGGKVISQEWDSALGFGWSGGDRPRMGLSDMSDADNFLCTIPALVGGVKQPLKKYGAGVNRSCRRTWWGFDAAGKCFIECTSANYALNQIVARMATLGIVDGLVLDGSGSAQSYDGATRQKGDGRAIYSYLLLWFDASPKEGKKIKICLDPGHGGDENYNCSPDKSYYEHEFALDLARRTRLVLERCGLEAVLTREKDETVSTARRATLANQCGADIFVSIHSNSVGGNGWDDKTLGACIYTYAAGGKRDELANKLLKALESEGANIFGVGLYHKKYTVLANTTMPAVLIEYGFHTAHSDVKLLASNDYRDKLAEATASGICAYFCLPYQGGEKPSTLEKRVDRLETWAEAMGMK